MIDYASDYPERNGRVLARVSYEELKRGEVTLLGRTVESSSMPSYAGAREIAGLLADELRRGDFLLARRWPHRRSSRDPGAEIQERRP